MAGSPYASALGRLKVQFPLFVGREFLNGLFSAKDIGEITKRLESTPYGTELVQAAASYSGATLLEIAINRTFVKRNRLALDAAPFAGKPAVAAYLRKWDIQNLELILSAKAQGRPVSDAEPFLVSSRDVPAGFAGGTMTLDDFRLLLQQPTLEAIAQSLVRFGYGGALLPLMDRYAQSHDIFPLLVALDREYYQRVFEATRFFQGDEGVVRKFLESEIDVRNLLLLLKAKDADVPAEEVSHRFIDGGEIARAQVPDLYGSRGVPEIVSRFTPRYPSLVNGNSMYEANRSLTGYEVALQRERAIAELNRMKSYPLSLAILFTFLLLSELERADLRRIIYGKLYGVPDEELSATLVLTQVTI
ncbi:MAG: V-type ATPase subunit [Thermoplasmata archaeon]